MPSRRRAIIFAALLSLCFLPFSNQTLAEPPLKEASFYQKLKNNLVSCQLCPRKCAIPDGRRGFCGVRENRKGTLYTLSYGRLVSMNFLDPVEKKPLFHFLPGSRTFSIATAGCNMKCSFCQNWEISQASPSEMSFAYVEPRQLIQKVINSGTGIIAYTYTEPTIFFEYMLECAKLARQAGLRNVMHSNGFINQEPLEELCKYLDAANIDLKAFSEDYYFKMSEGALAPVLESLKTLKSNGVHLEITTLVIAGYNDDEESIRQMSVWIRDNLGADTPLHFSRAFPMYKLLNINPTPLATLERAARIAGDSGLKFVYIGNIGQNPAENTYCPKCGKLIIERNGFSVSRIHMKDGRCAYCGEVIPGVWK